MMTCDYCGVEFECCHKRRLEAKHHFCSRKCMGAYNAANNPNLIPCEVCGKLIKVKPRVMKRQKNFTCSRECVGILRRTIYAGENNPNYGNVGMKNPMSLERTISNYGYVLLKIPDHPFARHGGWVLEHRYVAEKYLLTKETSVEIDGKRYLRRDLNVHHIDGNKLNNDMSNLMIITRSEHMKLHPHGRKKKETIIDDDCVDGVRTGGFGSTGR